MKKEISPINYSGWQVFALTSLRVLIGWHFLYEGLVKLYTPGWSAKAYLLGSVGPLSSLFRYMAGSETILQTVNILNEWGLVIIGFGLFVGLFSKICKISAMILLFLYYMAYPPFAGLNIDAYVEGSYWIVNKNLIEIGALFVLYGFPSSRITGLDRLLNI